MPLFGDEAYYLLWADRLAPAYLDHPAGIAFLLKVSTALLGRNEFGVRWLNALLSTACVPLAYAVGRRYVSTLGGLIAATAVALGPAYLITGRVVYPDTLQMVLVLVNLLSLAPLLEGRGTLPALGLVRPHSGAAAQRKTELRVLCRRARHLSAGVAARPPAAARVVVGGRVGRVGTGAPRRVEPGA